MILTIVAFLSIPLGIYFLLVAIAVLDRTCLAIGVCQLLAGIIVLTEFNSPFSGIANHAWLAWLMPISFCVMFYAMLFGIRGTMQIICMLFSMLTFALALLV